MSTKYTESRYAGEHIVSEASGTRSREQGVLITGQNLVAGTVLGVITASGKLTQFNQDGSNGSENAAGVLFAAVDATSADADAVAHLRDCEMDDGALTWPADIDAAEKTAAKVQLTALGIIAR